MSCLRFEIIPDKTQHVPRSAMKSQALQSPSVVQNFFHPQIMEVWIPPNATTPPGKKALSIDY